MKKELNRSRLVKWKKKNRKQKPTAEKLKSVKVEFDKRYEEEKRTETK